MFKALIQLYRYYSLIFLILSLLYVEVKGQAGPPSPANGQGCTPVREVESITNGDFEKGNIGFKLGETAGSYQYVKPGEYSNPGWYQVDDNDTTIGGVSKSTFNQESFAGIYDHTQPGGKNGKMLMIDQARNENISWYTTVDVIPNQIYYFSAWVIELSKNTANANAKLQFQILLQNGTVVNIGDAFTTNNTWRQTFATWNSESHTRVTLRISDVQTIYDNGNDYALDDISFINGCSKIGAVTPSGGDQTLCTEGSVKINSNMTGTHTWYKFPLGSSTGGSEVDGQTGSELTVNAAGTYQACILSNDSKTPNCPITTSVDVAGSISVDLGPDVTLCNPPSDVLDTKLTGSKLTYEWTGPDGVMTDKTGPTIETSKPGTYSVTVRSSVPGCASVTDSKKITSNLAIAQKGTFCRGNAKFEITSQGGKYGWYKTANIRTDRQKLGEGNSVTVPVSMFNLGTAPGDTLITLYVEDTTQTPRNAGSPIANSSRNYQTGGVGKPLNFTVLKGFVLNSVNMRVRFYSAGAGMNGSVSLMGPSGEIKKVPVTIANTSTGSQVDIPVTVTFNQMLNEGSYRLILNTDNSGGNSQISAEVTNSDNRWNQYGIPDLVTLSPISDGSRDYFFFYDWKISEPLGCGRIPVTLTKLCGPCQAPTFKIKASSEVVCTSGNPNTITLSIVDLSPATPEDPANYQYNWYKGQTNLTPNANDTLKTSWTVTPADNSGLYKVRIGHQSLTDKKCFSEDSVTITFESPVVNKGIYKADTICEGDGLSAFELGGTAAISGGKSPYSIRWVSSSTANIADTVAIPGATQEKYSPSAPTTSTYYRRVVKSSGVCPAVLSDSAFVNVNPKLNPGTIDVTTSPICQFTVPGLVNVTAASGGVSGQAVKYTWQVREADKTNFTDIPNSNTAGLPNAGPLEATSFYQRVAQSGLCSATTPPVEVVVIPGLDPGIISPIDPLCNADTPKPITATAGKNGSSGTITYTWQKSTDNQIFTDIAGTSSTTVLNYTPANETGTFYFRRMAVGGAQQCDIAYTESVEYFKAIPITGGTIRYKGDTLCGLQIPDSVINLSSPVNGTPSNLSRFTYTWERSEDGINFTALSNIDNPDPGINYKPWSALPARNQITTWHFRRLSTEQCGQAYSDIVKVVVKPMTTPAVVIKDPGAICFKDQISLPLEVISNRGRNPIYKWELFDGSNSVDVGNTGVDTFFTNTANWPVSDNLLLQVTLTASQDICPTGPATYRLPLVITGPTDPEVDLVANDTNICSLPVSELMFSAIVKKGGGSEPRFIFKRERAGETIVVQDTSTVDSYSTNDLMDGDIFSVMLKSNSQCANTTLSQIATLPIGVIETPLAEIGGEAVICAGSQTQLVASGGLTGSNFQWYLNSIPLGKGTSQLANKAGVYNLEITNSKNGQRCIGSDELNLIVEDPTVRAKTINGHQIDEIYRGDSIQIIANVLYNPLYDKVWSVLKGDTLSFISENLTMDTVWVKPGKTTSYEVSSVSPLGCKATEVVQIRVFNKIRVPNAISPNGDGVNDNWDIEGLEDYTDATVKIFNRWGNLVWESRGYDMPWNGKTKAGEYVQAATYYYVIDPQHPKGDGVYTGWVVVVK